MNDLLKDIAKIEIDTGDGIYTDADGRAVARTADDGTLRVTLGGVARASFVRLLFNEQTDPGALVLGDTWERTYGCMGWKPFEHKRLEPWFFFSFTDGVTKGYGVRVCPNAFAGWKIHTNRLELILDVRNGTCPVSLDGRELDLCEVVSRSYEGVSAYRAAQDFMRLLSPHPYLSEQPIYGGNNWYYAYGNSSREQILNDAKLQAELSEGLSNRPFMVVDDGWSVNRTAGPWVSNEKFGDMATLAEEIKKMDVRPGIWVRLLYTKEERADLAHIHGKYLDPTDPMVMDYVKDVIRTLRGWGYELIKHDFTAIDLFDGQLDDMGRFPATGDWHFKDMTRTTAEIVKDLYKTIRDVAGDDTIILGCNTVSYLGVGQMQASRTGDDTSGVVYGYTLRHGYNALGFKLMQNRTFFAADPDCIGILPNTIPWEKTMEWASLVAKSGSPFFISCAYETMTKSQRLEMRELYKIASKAEEDPEPVDWFETYRPKKYQ